MKRRILRISVFFSVLLSLFTSCETDFDLTADWKDITIVYGLMSQNDSVHYFKINKAFLGEGNAYTYAQIADSSSYGNSIEVTVTETGKNGSVRNFTCDTTTIYDKEPGIFYYPDQVVYKTAFKVPSNLNDQDYTYALKVRNKNTGKIVSAETQLVKDFVIETPRPGQLSIDFISESNQKVKWISAQDGKRYNVVIRFWFDEVKNLYDTTQRYIDWDLTSIKSSGLNGGESMEILYDPLNFYPVCKNQVPYNDDRENSVTSRLVDRAEFRISVAGDDLNTYMEVNEPSTGIVQDKPDYTNITNGKGLFSCRYTKSASISIGTRTEERLIDEDIKFVNKLGN